MSRVVFLSIFLISFHSSFAWSKKFSSCSEKWLHQTRKEAPWGLGVLFVTAGAIPPIFGPAFVVATSNTRKKSKAAYLLESAEIMYTFRKQKYLVESEHIDRVQYFYNKYLASDSLKELSFSDVIRVLAKYNKIAYDFNKCRVFGFSYNGETLYSRKSIAEKIFPRDSIDKEVLKDISRYEDHSKRILRKRKKEIDEWAKKNEVTF